MPTEQERVDSWLRRCIGEWTLVPDGSENSPQAGGDSVRALGGPWIAFESRVTAPASDASTMLMTLGYDPARNKIIGAVVASMMSHLWIYEGSLAADGSAITLETEGPSVVKESESGKYRDTMTFENDDRRVFTSSYLGDDGAYHEFMRFVYQRVG